MKRHHQSKGRGHALQGPSQRQLRAGELIRHALVEVLREEELADEAMQGVSVTVTEVRLSPDLRNATVFVEPLGGGHADARWWRRSTATPNSCAGAWVTPST